MDEGPKAHALHDAADRNSPAFLHGMSGTGKHKAPTRAEAHAGAALPTWVIPIDIATPAPRGSQAPSASRRPIQGRGTYTIYLIIRVVIDLAEPRIVQFPPSGQDHLGNTSPTKVIHDGICATQAQFFNSVFGKTNTVAPLNDFNVLVGNRLEVHVDWRPSPQAETLEI